MTNSSLDVDTAPSCMVNEWDQYLETMRPDIGHKQYSWWANFLTRRRWNSFGVVARDGSTICGGATVLFKSFAPGKCFYYIPHGPVLPNDEADAAELFGDVLTYVDQRRREESQQVSHLRIEPRWLQIPDYVQGFQQAPGWIEPRDTLHLDLSLSEDELLGQMKKKGRYNIRLARRHGVTVVEDTSPDGIDDFMRLYKAMAERQGINRRTTDYFRSLAATLFPHDRGSIFFAEYEGVRIAATFVVYGGDTATYKYGGSIEAHRHVMAPYLLQFESMLKAKAIGLRWYDLYGVSSARNPIDKWENFTAFKRKFGGRELNFVPALDFIYDSEAYQAYRDWEIS